MGHLIFAFLLVAVSSLSPALSAAQQPGPSPPATPIEIVPGGNVKAPALLKHVGPVYPAYARANRLGGVVVLDVTIDARGKVVDVKVARSIDPSLDAAAQAAVRQWEYMPTVIDGRPVAVKMSVNVNFTLSPSAQGQSGTEPPRMPFNLTGTWRSDDGGTYQMRTVDYELFWSGSYAAPLTPGPNIFHGRFTAPDVYSGFWIEMPPGASSDAGLIFIRVVDENHLILLGSPTGIATKTWNRVIAESGNR